jgi:co-chaperonin GroES (HSP10)
MLIKMISLLLLGTVVASGQNSEQTSDENKGEVTVTGCVSRLNTNFILMQSEPAQSFKLEEGKKVKLEQYLGKEVEITGEESHSLSSSSPSATTANPLTLKIHSLKLIHKRCSAH